MDKLEQQWVEARVEVAELTADKKLAAYDVVMCEKFRIVSELLVEAAELMEELCEALDKQEQRIKRLERR